MSTGIKQEAGTAYPMAYLTSLEIAAKMEDAKNARLKSQY
jgi:hypothetical protein